MNAHPVYEEDCNREPSGAYAHAGAEELDGQKIAWDGLASHVLHNLALMEEINAERERRGLAPLSLPSMRKELSRQIDATLEERGKRYGSYMEKAHIIQQIKDIIRAASSWDKMDPDMKESLDNVVQKIGRIVTGDPEYHDNWHDVIGYTKLVADRLEGVQR